MADSASSTNSTAESNEITETMKLLDEGRAKIVLSEKYRDVTLVLGITGAGKTTFVQWLAGDDSKLIAVLEEGTDDDYIIEDGNRIGNSTIESKTKFPELVVSADTDTPYYDCPGFIDTRGIGNDITSTYFIKVVAEHAKSVKMIFVIDYPSVRKTGNRDVFTNLLKHSTEVMKDVDKFKGGIALVATKVENKIVQNKDGTFGVLSDAKMITPIAFFLRSVKDDLAKTSTNADLKLIKFIDAVLQSEDGGESYPKIGLFRRPNTDGPLSEIKLLQEGKKKIVAMVNKLKYVPVEASDFGYTISDKSKNNINGLITEINNRVWNEVDNIVKGVKKHYDGIVGEMSLKINSFATAKDAEANLVEAQSFASKLNLGSKKMSELVSQMTTNSTTITELHEKLKDTLSSLEITACQANLATIDNQASYFEFLQKVSESPLSTQPWESLLQQIVESLSASNQSVQANVNNVVEKVLSQVSSTVSSIASELWQVKLNKIKSVDIQKLPIQLSQDYSIVHNMTLELSKANSTEQLATIISKNVALLDLDTDLIKSKTLSVFTRAKYLSYLQVISDHPLITWSLDWIAPFNQTAKTIQQSSKWYRFLNGLFVKLGEYEFQQDTSQFNVASLENWGDGQGKTPGIQITEKNFGEFLTKLSQYNIDEYEAVKSAQISDWQLNELNQMLGLTLKHSKFYSKCNEQKQLTVTGDYVKLSDLIKSDNNTLAADLCPNGEKPNSVSVFATNTVFIDGDLDVVGQKLKLAILAPKWEIVGSNRTIDLNGSAQLKNFSKSNNGTKPGNSGDAGKPGLPGGSAGTFLGLGKMFLNGQHLTISATGGEASAGQDGGDGKAGENGNDGETPSKKCIIVGDHVLIKEYPVPSPYQSITIYVYRVNGTKGSEGGSGGAGGAGGIGGVQGVIKLFSLDSPNSGINSIAESGTNGTVGAGGLGSDGGKNGNEVEATCQNTASGFSSYTELILSTTIKVDTRAKAGENGTAGGNPEKPKKPESPATIEHQANSLNEFKSYLRENLNDSNDRFKRSSIIQFIDQLDRDAQVKASYDTLALTDELQGLEVQSRTMKNREDLIYFYRSLQERIAKYAETLKKSSAKSEQNKMMLNYLYAATLGKLYNLKAGEETNLIIDVEGYLSYVQENMNTLNKLRQKHNEHEIVKQNKEKYQSNIEQQIEEAKQFIETQVTPEFDKISKEIDEQIETLITETIELQKKAKENKDKLIETREKLQTQLFWRGVFSIVKIGSQVTTFLGPFGMAIGTAVGAADSLAEGFLFDDQTADQKEFKLPPSITSNIKLLETDSKAFNEKVVKDMKEKIDEISKELKPVPELDDVVKRLEEIKKKLAENDPPLPDDPDRIDVVIVVDEEVKREMEAKEKDLKDKKEKAEKVSEDALAAMKIANKISQMSTVALEIYSKYRGDKAKIAANDEALKDMATKLKQLDEYKRSIYKTISPGMKKLTSDLAKIQSKLGTKSQVALDVSNWQVQSMLKNVKLQMQQLTKGQTVEDSMARCIEKLQDAMSILIKIYDRIQSFQQQQELANFIAQINSPESNQILDLVDPQLSAAVNRLDIVIRSNVVLRQYDAAVAALKQLVFPYARHYMETMTLPSKLNFNEGDIDELVTRASGTLDRIKSKLVENKTKISEVDKNTHSFDFDSTKPCIQAPFYVWSSAEHGSELAKLLSGESVTLKADIRRSDLEKDAIKFLKVNLNFKAKNPTLQPEIDTKLEMFKITANHTGNSFYRYGGKYYVISHESLDIEYSFAKRVDGYPIDSSRVFDKIQNGTLTLSPYAMWKIQLSKMNKTASFDQLAVYKDKVDLELVGPGRYIKSAVALNNDLQLEKYYREYVDDDDAAEPDVAEQYESQQLASVKIMKKVKCREELAKLKNSNSIHRSDEREPPNQAINSAAPLSYISRISRTVSNYFGGNKSAPEKTHIMNPRFEYAKQHNSTNLTQASSSVDVHGNLLMGQLLVGLIAGKNNTITSESYMSPEQTRNLEVDRLAQSVEPALSQSSGTRFRSNQLPNSNNQWHREWNGTNRNKKHNLIRLQAKNKQTVDL